MNVTYVPANELRLIRGTDAAILKELADSHTASVFVAQTLDDGEWYVLGWDRLHALKRSLAGADPPRMLRESSELAHARLVDPAARPDMPAVVVHQDRLVGASIPRPFTERRWGSEYLQAVDRTITHELKVRGRESVSRTPGPETAQDAAATAETAADGVTATGEPTLRRTPHMQAPGQLRPGGFDIRVYTNTEAMADAEGGQDVAIEVPADVQEVDLGVLLTTTAGLEVDGDFFGTLTVRRDEPAAEGVRFRVLASEDAIIGDAGLIAQFVHRGRPCGRVARRWRNGRAIPLVQSGGATVAHTTAAEPDLTVFISAPINDGIHYQCSVVAANVPGFEQPQHAPWALPEAAAPYISQLLAEFVDRTKLPQDRRDALRGAGLQLFGATPKLFQAALWALLDAHQDGAPPPTVFIASDEPLLPWELMIPTRMSDGIADDRTLPLGVECALGRWIRSDVRPPPQRFVVATSALVAAVNVNNPARQLDSSLERDALTRLFAAEQATPATLADLDRWFGEHPATLVHVVCHGAAEAFDDAIFLDNDERCTSMGMRVSPGFQKLCGTSRPLVFLNACDTARQAPVVGGGAGFPRVLTDLGARAVIAPLWPVSSTIAAEAAVQLYEATQADGDRSIADLLRDVRRRAYEDEPFEDSFAAYCFFGDPCTRLELRQAHAAPGTFGESDRIEPSV